MSDRVTHVINERQREALLPHAAGGACGGLTAGKYNSVSGASPATATRDLADLVAKDALVRTGEWRQADCTLTIPLRPVAPIVTGATGGVE
jgi:Fic family protein